MHYVHKIKLGDFIHLEKKELLKFMHMRAAASEKCIFFSPSSFQTDLLPQRFLNQIMDAELVKQLLGLFHSLSL